MNKTQKFRFAYLIKKLTNKKFTNAVYIGVSVYFVLFLNYELTEICVMSVGCKFIDKILQKNDNNFRNTDDDYGNCFIHIIIIIPLGSYTLLKNLGSIIYAIDISRYYN